MAWQQLAHATVLKTLDTIVLRTVDEVGTDCVVKLYRTHRAARLKPLAGIARYLEAVQKQYPRLRLQTLLHPKPQQVDYGLLIGQSSDPRLLVAYRWIAGKPPQRITAKLCHQMGQTMGMLHHVSETFSEQLALTHIGHRLLSGILVMVTSRPAFAEVPPLQQRLFAQNMLALIEHMASVEDEPGEYGIIHSDLHLGNWLRHNNQLAPIDFDEAAYGHYLTDLAVVLLEIETDAPLSHRASLQQQVLNGYQAYRKLGKHQLEELEFKKLTAWALYLNWAFGAQHEEIFAQKNKKNRALLAIQKIAENPLVKKLGKRI